MPVLPLSQEEVERLMRPDLRTLRADLCALRDALDRMQRACEALAQGMVGLQRAAERLRDATRAA